MRREQAEYDAKKARQEAKRAAGKKPGGRPLKAPVAGPLPGDQVNLTDEESRIMPVPGGGYDQCYNAQAAVAADSLLVVACDVTQATNDKQQVDPMLEKLTDLPDQLGKIEDLLADTGYFSEANVNACAAAGIVPLIATGRQAHHPSLEERQRASTAGTEKTPYRLRRCAIGCRRRQARSATRCASRWLSRYLASSNRCWGFRQCLLRGLDQVRSEWSLVTMSWNIKRMFVSGGGKLNQTAAFMRPSPPAEAFWCW